MFCPGLQSRLALNSVSEMTRGKRTGSASRHPASASRPSSRPPKPGCHSRNSVISGVCQTLRCAERRPAARIGSRASIIRRSLLQLETCSRTAQGNPCRRNASRNKLGQEPSDTVGFDRHCRKEKAAGKVHDLLAKLRSFISFGRDLRIMAHICRSMDPVTPFQSANTATITFESHRAGCPNAGSHQHDADTSRFPPRRRTASPLPQLYSSSSS